MKSPEKLRNRIILKKKWNNEERANPTKTERENILNIKDLEKAKRELEKQNATLRTVNLNWKKTT